MEQRKWKNGTEISLQLLALNTKAISGLKINRGPEETFYSLVRQQKGWQRIRKTISLSAYFLECQVTKIYGSSPVGHQVHGALSPSSCQGVSPKRTVGMVVIRGTAKSSTCGLVLWLMYPANNTLA